MLAGDHVRINGSGLQTRDYIFVSDVVAVLMSGLKHLKSVGPYHVGTGKETSVKSLYKKLANLTGCKLKPQKGPADIGALQRSVLDNGKLRREFGWSPKVDLDTGLKLTVDWFRDNV